MVQRRLIREVCAGIVVGLTFGSISARADEPLFSFFVLNGRFLKVIPTAIPHSRRSKVCSGPG